MALNLRQRRFVDEYMIDLNATQAAKRAGYSAKTAYSQGFDLLKHPEISALIAGKRAKLANQYEVSQTRIVEELAKLGFSNMQDYMAPGPNGEPMLDFSKLTRDQAAALTEVTVDSVGKEGAGEDQREVRRVKFKLADKRAALVDLGKHLGMFSEKIEHSGPGGGPIVVSELTPIERAQRIAAILETKRAKKEAS